jgi:hypothetical protein
MPWAISWLGATRGNLQRLARERFLGLSDAGQAVVQKVEEEIKLHPLPAPDLAQVRGEQSLSFGPIQVVYFLDSHTGEAEVRNVSLR